MRQLVFRESDRGAGAGEARLGGLQLGGRRIGTGSRLVHPLRRGQSLDSQRFRPGEVLSRQSLPGVGGFVCGVERLELTSSRLQASREEASLAGSVKSAMKSSKRSDVVSSIRKKSGRRGSVAPDSQRETA